MGGKEEKLLKLGKKNTTLTSTYYDSVTFRDPLLSVFMMVNSKCHATPLPLPR